MSRRVNNTANNHKGSNTTQLPVSFFSQSFKSFWDAKHTTFLPANTRAEDSNLSGLVFVEISLTWMQEPEAEKSFFSNILPPTAVTMLLM